MIFRSKIRIAIVDDHKLFRDGMASLLKNYGELSVQFEAEHGLDFFDKLTKRKRPIDVLLLDVEMPEMDGMAVLKKLKTQYPDIKPLILTRHNEDELIYELIELGAKGFLQKSADIEEVVDAIHSLNNNDLYFNDEVSKRVIKKLVRKENLKRISISNELTDREKEIIILICNEYTSKEIGEKLFISDRTVDSHKTKIFEKTKSKNTAGIVMYAVRTGMIE